MATDEEQPAAEPQAAEPRAALRAAAAAFDSGDYRRTRTLAEQALQGDDPSARRDASRLLAQLDPPQLTKLMLTLTGALLVLVTLFAYSQN